MDIMRKNIKATGRIAVKIMGRKTHKINEEKLRVYLAKQDRPGEVIPVKQVEKMPVKTEQK